MKKLFILACVAAGMFSCALAVNEARADGHWTFFSHRTTATCGSPVDVIEWAESLDLQQRASGVSQFANSVQVWVDPQENDWAVIVFSAGGAACVLELGSDYTEQAFKVGEPT